MRLTSYLLQIVLPELAFTVINDAPTTGIITVQLSAGTLAPLEIGKEYTWFLKYVLDGKTMTWIKGTIWVL